MPTPVSAIATKEEINEIMQTVMDNQLRDVMQQIAKISEKVAQLKKAQGSQMDRAGARHIETNAALLAADVSLLPAE